MKIGNQVVRFLHGKEIISVMMRTMLPAVNLMVETVVDLMLIQLFAQYANANKELQLQLQQLQLQEAQHHVQQSQLG